MTLKSVLEGPCIFLLGFGFDSHSILCSYTLCAQVYLGYGATFYGSCQDQLIKAQCLSPCVYGVFESSI